MKNTKQKIADIIAIIFFLILLTFIAITPMPESREIKRQKLKHLQDSLESEKYKKQLDSNSTEHSRITDSTLNSK